MQLLDYGDFKIAETEDWLILDTTEFTEDSQILLDEINVYTETNGVNEIADIHITVTRSDKYLFAEDLCFILTF